MKIKISFISIVILLVVGGWFGKMWLDDYYGKKLLIANQNRLADSTKIARLELDSVVMYHRYARVVEINEELLGDNSALLADRNEKVLSLIKAEIRIKELESEEVTTEIDTVNNELYFRDIQRDFYVYDLFVSFPRAYHKLSLTIHPFTMSVIVTEKISNGVYSGYVSFAPALVNDYLTVENMEIYIDESFFDKIVDAPVLRLGLAIGVLAGETNLFAVGVGALLGNRHYLDAKYAIGNNTILANYTWLFW